MLNEAIEVEISQPGRPTGKYSSLSATQLKLEELIFPTEPLPFDLAYLPGTATREGDCLGVMLLGNISHPPRTIVSGRVLGAIGNNGNGLFILATTSLDPIAEELIDIADLPEKIRAEISGYLKVHRKWEAPFDWIDKEETERIIRDAVIRFRQEKLETRKRSTTTPAWQPIDRTGRVIGYTEAEHYTEAEYTYFQLPYQFQHYFNTFLADDERILYALRRPAMRSSLQHSWLGGAKLQEGVLILTNQRLVHLVELMPPDSSGVRYGFNAQLGPLERLSEFSLEPYRQVALFLRTCWVTKQNTQTLEWEFPLQAGEALDELRNFLQKFVDHNTSGLAIRRAMPASPPEKLPRLTDPAANSPEELEPINERFNSLLGEWMAPGETAQAWALWPAWFEKRGYPQILLVTDRRLLILSDPGQSGMPSVEVQLDDLATLEYEGSILSSHIGLHIAQEDRIQPLRLTFPYSGEKAFRHCFEALRRCMAAIPLRVV